MVGEGHHEPLNEMSDKSDKSDKNNKSDQGFDKELCDRLFTDNRLEH